MSTNDDANGTPVRLDEEDRMILRQIQADASLPMERLGKKVGPVQDRDMEPGPAYAERRRYQKKYGFA